MKTEFEFIELIKKSAIRRPHSAIRNGIGDDCAVIRQNSQKDLVITTDLLVEEVDFRLDWTTAEFLGQKALAVSLSDVAAMGAKPLWALLSIGVPARIWNSDFLDKFYAGWFRLAKKSNVALVGGDVSRTPDKIVIDSIVAGEVVKNNAVLRSGAKPGDAIFVTGKLGGAAAGLELLENGARLEMAEKWQRKFLRKQLAPTANGKIGAILGKENLATAMIDLSDGLSSDLAHLCAASKTGAQIYAADIPAEKSLKRFFPNQHLEMTVNGGEDFELLFTADKKNFRRIEKMLGKKVSRIGLITDNAGNIELIGDSGTTILEPKGFRHF